MTAAERDRAQRRWLAGVQRIENGSAARLRSLLKSPERDAVIRVQREVENASSSPDPLVAMTLSLPAMSNDVEQMFGPDSLAEREMGQTAMAAFVFGAREGRARASTVAGERTPAIPPDQVARSRRTERDEARAYARAWQEENGRAVARAAVRGAVTDVSTGAATVGIGIAAALSYRSLYAARNVTADAGRRGMFASFGQAGMGAWTWHAEFGACQWCWSRSGISFPAYQPFRSHPNCKCSAIPSATVESGGYDADALFSALPASQQVSVLGPGKQALYSAGRFSIRDLARPNGGVRSLAELS